MMVGSKLAFLLLKTPPLLVFAAMFSTSSYLAGCFISFLLWLCSRPWRLLGG